MVHTQKYNTSVCSMAHCIILVLNTSQFNALTFYKYILTLLELKQLYYKLTMEVSITEVDMWSMTP